MRSIKLSMLAMAVSGLVMTSCEKSDNNPGTASSGSGDLTMKALMDPAIQAALAKSMAAHFQVPSNAKGTKFIAPFFLSDGFGIIKDLVLDTTGPFPVIVSGELASFSADLDGNDFYRENNDGTISIHVTDNHAEGAHLNFGTGVENIGEDCNLNMNYTGTPLELCFPDPNGNIICFKIIDISQNPNAISFHGVGKVRVDENSPWLDLSAKWVTTPGGKNNHITLELK